MELYLSSRHILKSYTGLTHKMIVGEPAVTGASRKAANLCDGNKLLTLGEQ